MLPLFPLSLIVFPNEPLNLHVFEPRYRQLVLDCIEDKQTFGIPPFLNEELQDYGANVTIFDPHANVKEVYSEYKLESSIKLPNKKFDGVVLAVAHKEFHDLNFEEIKKEKSILYDVKNFLDSKHVDKSL